MASPPFPTCLPEDAFDRSGRQIVLWMRDCHSSGFDRVLELVVAALDMHKLPAVRFQALYDFPTIHSVYYTHGYTDK